MLSGHLRTSLAQITRKVPKHSRRREGWTRLPSSWCYTALCASLPQAVSYRHCSQILGKGGCLLVIGRGGACTVTKHHFPLPFFFFFLFLVAYPWAISSCHTVTTVTSLNLLRTQAWEKLIYNPRATQVRRRTTKKLLPVSAVVGRL